MDPPVHCTQLHCAFVSVRYPESNGSGVILALKRIRSASSQAWYLRCIRRNKFGQENWSSVKSWPNSSLASCFGTADWLAFRLAACTWVCLLSDRLALTPRWLALTCVDLRWLWSSSKSYASWRRFSPFGHPRQSTQVDRKSSVYVWTCGPTQLRIRLATAFASSGFANFRWLASICESVSVARVQNQNRTVKVATNKNLNWFVLRNKPSVLFSRSFGASCYSDFTAFTAFIAAFSVIPRGRALWIMWAVSCCVSPASLPLLSFGRLIHHFLCGDITWPRLGD